MDWKEIRKEYESTDISLSDLAVRYGLKYNTVKSRSKREQWKKGAPNNAPLSAPKKVQGASSAKAGKGKSEISVNVNKREKKINESLDLTEKQVLFVAEYLTDFNATRSAMAAGYSKKTAYSIGWENLRKPEIQVEIKRQTELLTSELGITSQRVLLEYLKIAFADITQYTEFGRIEQYIIREGQKVKGENGEYLKEYVNYINLKNHDEVDGALISEVKEGKTGISIKLHDKMKAMEALTKYLDLLPDNHKRLIEDEKLKLDQAKFDMDKAKATGSTGIDANNERILTLAKLVNNPVPNRNAEDFEEDDESGDCVSTEGSEQPNG